MSDSERETLRSGIVRVMVMGAALAGVMFGGGVLVTAMMILDSKLDAYVVAIPFYFGGAATTWLFMRVVRKARADLREGMTELIRGRIIAKHGNYKSSLISIVVGSDSFALAPGDAANYSVGDLVSVDLAPRTRLDFRIAKNVGPHKAAGPGATPERSMSA